MTFVEQSWQFWSYVVFIQTAGSHLCCYFHHFIQSNQDWIYFMIYGDTWSFLHKYCLRLDSVQPLLWDWRLPGHPSRQEEITPSRLCIGDTHLTHSSRANGENVPICVACDCDLTVEHILIECGDFAEVRQKTLWCWEFKTSMPGNRFYRSIWLLWEVGLFDRIWVLLVSE